MTRALTFGAFIPQGWKGEYVGIADPREQWQRTVDIAVLAEELGFDSVWVYDTSTMSPGRSIRRCSNAGR